MSPQREKSLPFNKILILSLFSLLLVNLSSASTIVSHNYECPKSCTCDYTENRLKCANLDGLIASLNSEYKQHSGLQPVEALDLSNNQLAKVTNQLELLENLKELNLSHNSLTQVSKWRFKHLQKLDLSHNHITSAKLAKLPIHILYLNLSNNDITYLPLSLMKLKKLRAIELDGNPINCTCDTLHVRNWLSSNYVWSDRHIKCMGPQSVKGQPWLQVKQIEICHQEVQASGNTGGKYEWDNYDDDNELMMADDAGKVFDEDEGGSGDDAPEEDQIDDDHTDDHTHDHTNDEAMKAEQFLPVQTTEKPAEDTGEEEEGSGGDIPIIGHVAASDNSSTTVAPLSESSTTDDNDDYDEEDESSGDGGVILPDVPEEYDEKNSTETDNDFPEAPEEHPISEPPEVDEVDETPSPVPTLSIFEDVSSTSAAPVLFRGLPTDKPADDSEVMGTTNGEVLVPMKAEESLKTAEQDDSGTIMLLVIIGIALLVLVIFVAMKNRKARSRNRREKRDVEGAPATELVDMAKPIEKNGHADHEKPLNGDSKTPLYSFQAPPSITVDEPLKENGKSNPNLYDNGPTSNGNGNIEPVHQSPPSNGSVPLSSDNDDDYHPALDHQPDSLAASPEVPKRYSPIYSPASPRSDRYSPVYEPETGRVKIKLTETPKPKTPVVVTRSRSKAGDYVTTHLPNQRSD